MISLVLRGATPAPSLSNKSFKRLAGFDPLRRVRSSRAKIKPGKDAGSMNGSAKHPRTRELGRKISGYLTALERERRRCARLLTEDVARRRLAAARACSGLVDRTQATARVPDAPVSKSTLSLLGGNKGLLQSDTNLCSPSLHATADITGQNGMSANQNQICRHPAGRAPRSTSATCSGRGWWGR
jgi:hypothetical protein